MTAPAPQLNFQPYIVSSRDFPLDKENLPQILSQMYFEVAYAINNRTIGTYDRFQIPTGNKYFNDGNPTNRLQSFRQVYTVSSIPLGTTPIASNISIDSNTQFVNIYGTAQNGSIAIPLTPWNMTRTDDAVYLRVNESTGNIEIITNSTNWAAYSAIIVLEYILNN